MLEKILFVKTVVIKAKMFIILFFECPCYDVEIYTLFKSMSDMGLQHPVTLNMFLFGESYISLSVNIALFNFIYTYMLQTNWFHWWYLYFLWIIYSYYMHIIITISNCCIFTCSFSIFSNTFLLLFLILYRLFPV